MAIQYAVCVPHPPLIIPEIGKGEEQKINQTIQSYHTVMKTIADRQPETVILISPHSTCYEDYIHISPGKHAKGSFYQYRAGQVKVECDYDEEFVYSLTSLCQAKGLRAGIEGERDKQLDHGTMIPLYFLNQYYTNYKVVRIGLSGLSSLTHYQLGELIKETADILEKNVVIIASGDLSHKLLEEGPYGYTEEGPQFDKEIVDIFKNKDFLSLMKMNEDFCEQAAECGRRSFIMMSGVFDKQDVDSHVYSYEGPFGVGYCVADFTYIKDNESRNFDKQYQEYKQDLLHKQKEKEDDYVKLARYAVERFVKTGTKPLLPEVCKELLEHKAGVFVSLHKNNHLRGCIGTFIPQRDNIAQEIVQNACSACSQDPRFHPVQYYELDDLEYSVDVLGELEDCTREDLNPKVYGILVTQGDKRGLLLPDLDGVDTIEDQIQIACDKAMITDINDIDIRRFKVTRHL